MIGARIIPLVPTLKEEEEFEIGQKPISNPKSEISNRTRNGMEVSIKTAGGPGSAI